ncbi:Importin-13, partial [Geodia barretti]
MLHNKISKSWSELPREQYEGLRVELFSEIARSSGQGPRLVLIQLCRCLVAFAFATVPDIWPNTVVSMVHSLRDATRSIQDSDFPTSVLQLLTILPEEYERTSEQMVAAKRGAIRRELKNGLPTVLSLLEEVLVSAGSDAVKIDAMKCFSSWVEFGLPLPEVQGFVGQLLQGLVNDELFTQACNTLADIVSKEESLKYPTALRNILRQVTKLGELCEKKLGSGDKEEAATLCRMLVEVVSGNMSVL